jgi:hypothetical protein
LYQEALPTVQEEEVTMEKRIQRRNRSSERPRPIFPGVVISVKILLTSAALIVVGPMIARATGFAFDFDANGNLLSQTAENIAPPQILSQPQRQVVAPGELASFFVVAANTNGLTYQWRFNGTNIPGATGDTLLLQNVGAPNEGQYDVVLTNSSGSMPSSSAALMLDSDDDGLADSWEVANFGNLSQTATGDFDGDGISNLDEFLDGTDPKSNASFRPRLNLTSTDGGTVAISPARLSYSLGEVVTLTATAFPPNEFGGWSGDVTSQNSSVNLTMNGNKSVVARFIHIAPFPPGVVSWWQMEGNANDSIGSNNPSATNAISFVPGKVGQAVTLNSGGYIDIPDSPTLDLQQLSIEAWARPDGPGPNNDNAGNVLIIKNINTSFGPQTSFNVNWRANDNRFNAAIYDVGVVSSDSFPPGVFYHVALTFDGATVKLYVNGVLEGQAAKTGWITYDHTVPLTFGANFSGFRSAGYPRTWNGIIDEVTLYNRALGSDEINAIYLADRIGKDTSNPAFTSTELPDAVIGSAYNQQLTTIFGTAPITFSISDGLLPAGLSLSSGGVISGTPAAVGTSQFAILATDANGNSTEQFYSLHVVTPAMPAGLVGWWRAEGNAQDSVGTNHGTAMNGATYTTGKVGQSFVFDGVDDYINIPDSAALRPASVTLEAWAMFNSSNGPVFCKPLGSATGDSYALYLLNGVLNGFIHDASASGVLVSSPFTLNTGQWYHVAFTFDANTNLQRLYVNGMLVATSQSYRNIGYDNHPVLLGQDINNGAFNFPLNGRIDEAAIYNRALTADEIAAIYASGAAGKKNTGPYINTASRLPTAFLSQAYSASITTFGGIAPVGFALSSGSLPPGLTMDSSGLISGTPNTIGTFTFTLTATDGAASVAQQTFTLQVVTLVATPPGIISWWKAENNAQDAIGTNHGTAMNGATYAAGKVGQSFLFDGVNDYISVPDAASLQPASLTLEAWVMFNSTSGPIIARALGSGVSDSYVLWLQNGDLNGTVCDATQQCAVLSTPFSPVMGEWYHVAFTFDGVNKEQALYINGARLATNQSNRAIGYDNHPVLIGGDIDNGSPSFLLAGRIDEAAIYNRALSPAEVAGVYNAGEAGKRPLTELEQWKYNYFGDINAPDSGDPDGDGQTNLFEFTAGLDPTNAASRFNFRIERTAGQNNLIFSPRFNDRTYTVTTRSNLNSGSWAPLTGATTSDNGTERTVTDPNPAAPKFYRVEITKP